MERIQGLPLASDILWTYPLMQSMANRSSFTLWSNQTTLRVMIMRQVSFLMSIFVLGYKMTLLEKHARLQIRKWNLEARMDTDTMLKKKAARGRRFSWACQQCEVQCHPMLRAVLFAYKNIKPKEHWTYLKCCPDLTGEFLLGPRIFFQRYSRTSVTLTFCCPPTMRQSRPHSVDRGIYQTVTKSG